MLSRSLISRANRAFRNPALLLSTAGNTGTVRIVRARDNKRIADLAFYTSPWDGHQSVIVRNAESGQALEFEEFHEAIHAIESFRWFPIREKNATRNFSRAVLKAEMEF